MAPSQSLMHFGDFIEYADGYSAAATGCFVPYWPDSLNFRERGMAAGLIARWCGVSLLPSRCES